MSFYIRVLHDIDKRYIKTNADLLVVEDYNNESEVYYFDNVFKCNRKITKSKNTIKINGYNKNLLLSKIDLKTMYDFFLNKQFDSIEILVPERFEDSEINTLVEQIYSYFKDNEFTIGLLISRRNYIENNTKTIEKFGFLISKFVQEIIIPNDDQYLMDYCLKSALIAGNLEQNQNAKLNNLYLQTCKPYNLEIEESFKQKLFKYLNKSNKTNVEVYTKGGITRKLFSKIMSEENYNPKKDTICCLIIGMELCLDDALDLLNAAGYTLSKSKVSDAIIRKFISDKEFNIEIINEELDKYGQMMLGWKPRETD